MKLTPMRVRGKRGGPKRVPWPGGKQRKLDHSSSATSSSRGSSARSTPSVETVSRRRRKHRNIELSRLEQLPTEVIQAIFEYSANLELPSASPRLASQLASRHLHHSLTSIILQSVLDDKGGTQDELHAAMRLMNSKFFTWSFFRSWLREQFQAPHMHPDRQIAYDTRFALLPDPASVQQHEEWTWLTLRPSIRLPPPTKLLRGSFTQDKTEFLRFLTRTFKSDPDDIDSVYSERAKEGLRQAVSEGATDALPSFWMLGMQPDTELLRLAVIDSGCDKELVRSLVNRIYNMTTDPLDIDFLDPALWMWAEKAKENGNEKGPWLRGLLKHAARVSSRIDAA